MLKPGYLLFALAIGVLVILTLTFRQDLLSQCQQMLPALCGPPAEPTAAVEPAPAAPAPELCAMASALMSRKPTSAPTHSAISRRNPA